MDANAVATLAERLASVDALALECDGLTRVISTLMQRDGIAHQVCVGSLTISDVGMIPLHWWIVLSDGRICDYRARMWLGQSVEVPHGLFVPCQKQLYTISNMVEPADIRLSEALFNVLTGMSLAAITLINGNSE